MQTIDDTLYDRDFYTWTKAQAAALRRAAAARVNVAVPIDWEHVAEEIEDMGKEQADKLESAYRILLLHLLKWCFQPDRRSPGWRGSIVEHRRRALRLIERNPGLKPRRRALFDAAYEDARAQAAAEADLPPELFPPNSPFTLDEALADGFFPETASEEP